jgi:hypothetical protein
MQQAGAEPGHRSEEGTQALTFHQRITTALRIDHTTERMMWEMRMRMGTRMRMRMRMKVMLMTRMGKTKNIQKGLMTILMLRKVEEVADTAPTNPLT